RLLDAGISSFQALRQNLTSEDQMVLDNLAAVRQELATLTFNPPAHISPDQYQSRLAQLEIETTDLEKTLAERSATFRTATQPITITTVQTQIPTKGVLVEYVRYRPVDVTAIGSRDNRLGDARYAAYLLFPDGRIEAVDLGDAAAIDAAVKDFSGLLRSPFTHLQAVSPGEAVPNQDAAIAATLRSLIFDPIAPYLADREHLLIAPDGQLNRIPLEALQTEPEGRYLVERYQISYLNSGRDLLKFNLAEPSTAPALLLANPDYDIADSTIPLTQTAQTPLNNTRSLGSDRRSMELGALQFGPLPGTAVEAAAIAPLLPNATILTEDQATENVLKTVAAPRILHIATHGFFLANVEPVNPNSRGLGIELNDASLFNASPKGVVVENPLLRSGLALAGFNARSSGREDGLLTALEAASLNLFGTQLVVLSACETGLGDIANGEGVYGLRRSFAIAGAATQLMSLWLVSDDGTQVLMARYYEKLMAGMGRSEALRATQLEMLKEQGQYSHPYYWASFILAGDWQTLA
ncbi:MAG: CHAT domain-containing protein, partial [Cyanobacteria bacterium J06636_16]